jgi:hypothetical protein
MRSPTVRSGRCRLQARSGHVVGSEWMRALGSRRLPSGRSSTNASAQTCFRPAWSVSHLLFSNWPVLWKAAGISSSITFARAAARSVMTSTGARRAAKASAEKRRAEAISLRLDTNTSMTWPC